MTSLSYDAKQPAQSGVQSQRPVQVLCISTIVDFYGHDKSVPVYEAANTDQSCLVYKSDLS